MNMALREWIPVYGSKHKRDFDQFWRCKTCGVESHSDFNEGPKNGLCSCGCKMISTPQRAYVEGYEKVKWNK